MRNRWIVSSLVAFFVACGKDPSPTPTPSGSDGLDAGTKPALLSVAALPSGELLVDGKSVGKTPVEGIELAPGERSLTVRRDGFNDWSDSVTVAAGESRAVDATLVATDPTDPVALAAMAEALELETVEAESSATLRSGGSRAQVLPIFPRGDVLETDLDQFRIDVTEEFAPGGKIEFRAGSKVLASLPFDPESFSTVIEIPAEVTAGAKPGSTITWGYYPEEGRAVTTKFKVRKLDSQLKRRIEKLDERIANQPELLQDQMRAQLWLNKRLYYAAYRGARSVVERAQSAPESLVIMQCALRRMELEDTALWEEIEHQVERLPSKMRSRFRLN